jgi:choline dehydrogenase-like flavoprotein
MLPVESNRLVFGAPVPAGVPEVHATFHIDAYTRAGWEVAESAMKRIFAAVDADAVPNFMAAGDYTGAGHIMGTTRMGNDPQTSVADKDARVHGLENLYLAGSGLFPTGGTSNPTLTVAALALRLAAHITEVLA